MDDLTTQDLDLFDKNLYIVLPFLKYQYRHFERGSACETNTDAWNISHMASIFHYFKIYGSLTLETKFTIELNMGDCPRLL